MSTGVPSKSSGGQILSGLASSRPTASGSGNLYLCKDMPVMYFDNPSTTAWEQYATEYMPKAAAASSYTTVGGMNLVQYADTIRALATPASYTTSSGLAACALISQSLSSSSAWSINLVATYQPQTNADVSEFGVIVTNGDTSGSSTAYGIICYGQVNTSYNSGMFFGEFTVGAGRTSVNNVLVPNGPNFVGGTGRVHLRLLNDGTNLHGQVSLDGFNWQSYYALASPFSPSYYGFMLGSEANSAGTTLYGQALIHEQTLNTSPLQYTITNNTNANPSVVTIGTHTIQAGDIVAIHGATTNLNSGTGSGAFACGWLVTAVGSTTITVLTTSTAAAGTAGTVTLLSR